MHNWKLKALGYLDGAWRYRWYGLIAAWLVCLAGWAGVATIKDRFVVSAKVYIDTDSLMGPLLKGLVVSSDPSQQIPIMLSRLITRPNIEQVIRLTNPGSARWPQGQMEGEISNIQGNVAIRPIGAKNLYAVSYADNSNKYAVSVTQTLLSILVDSNIGDKRRDTQQAQAFIDKRIEEYEALLREAEKRKVDFKEANLDLIARGGGSSRLDAANSNIQKSNEELGSAITKRDTLRQQLSNTPPTVAAGAATVIIGTDGKSIEPARGSPAQMLAQAKSQLYQLLLKYTENHPDVISTKKLITRLEEEVSANPATTDSDGNSANPGVPNPVYVQLRARLTEEEVNVAVARRHVDEANQELNGARTMIGRALTLEREQADLDRDYEVISANYQQLVKSRETAKMGQAITDEQSQIAFDVVEPPVEALFPSYPNRYAFNSVVLFAGLGIGLGFAFLLSLLADKFIVSSDLAVSFGLPVIGVVTQLRQATQRKAQFVSAFAMTASVGVLVAAYVGVLVMGRQVFSRFMGG